MHRRSGVVLVSALGLAGCATSALDMAPQSPDRPWVPATTASGEIIAGAPQVSRGSGGYVLPANPSLAAVPPPSPIAAKPYSLAELIDLAESSNPATRIAWNDARRTALTAGIAESAFLPKLTATALGGVQGRGGHQSVSGSSFNSDSSAHGAVSAVSLQWLLFDFGERSAVVDAAKQASLISNIAFTATHQQLIYDVSLAFYRHAAAEAHLATAAQSLKNAQSVQVAAEDRSKHGIGTIVEVAQARQGSAQANLELVQATGGAKDSYFALITAMGISPLTKLNVSDVSGRGLTSSMLAPVESIIAQALARRPDVQSAYAAQKASLANIRAAQAKFLPKFFLSVTGSYSAGDLNVTSLPPGGQEPTTIDLSGSHANGSIFVGVTVPLYDGGTRSAALAQARADADSANARMTQVRDEAVRQIVIADNALRTSLASYDASKSLENAAQTTFDAALAAYRSGVGSVTDLTLAESQLLQAKNASTDAYSTALSAAATLALATGTLGAAPEG
jgi:outer membrane protein TolC